MRFVAVLTALALIAAPAFAQKGDVQAHPCYEAGLLLESGDHVAALQAFERCLGSGELAPEDEATAHAMRGAVLLELQRYEEAVAAYDLAFAVARTQELGPTNPLMHRNRGVARYYAGRIDAALRDLAIAVEGVPNDLMTRLTLGIVYSDLGRDAEAVAEYDAVVRIEPGWAGGWINRSGALLKLGLNEAAISDARRAVEIEPEDGVALNALCWALVQDGRAETALPICEQAVAAEPEIGEIVHSLAAALEGVGRMDEARGLYARAHELSPDSETLAEDFARTRKGG